MIKFEHVSLSFGAGNFQLEDINFEVERGEFIFLIGPSGAGKTSILKMILREIYPKSGSVYVDDQLISSRKFKEVEKLRQKPISSPCNCLPVSCNGWQLPEPWPVVGRLFWPTSPRATWIR